MSDYERIARVIRYLDEHRSEQPDLTTLSTAAGLSPFHFHRLFSGWAGVTPKDFLQCLTWTHARRLLQNGESVLNASLEAGLSGPGRLHDLGVRLEAASPGEVKSGGEGWTLQAGFAESPFGTCLVAEGPRGICHLAFADSGERGAAWAAMEKAWPQARLQQKDETAAQWVTRIFKPARNARAPIRAFVRGTEFQVRVWQALLRIPSGALTTYGRLAAELGNPGAARAVGSAVGKNPLAWLIPCHRVIRETGAFGEYHWGAVRKRAIVAWENAR